MKQIIQIYRYAKENIRTDRKSSLWTMGISAVLVAALTVLSAMPTEVRWSEADVLLAEGMPFLCLSAAIVIFIGLWKHSRNAAWTDIAIFAWMLYYIGRVWLGAEYACSTDVLKTVCMFILYFVSRCLFSQGKMPQIGMLSAFLLLGIYEAGSGIWQMFFHTSRHYRYMITGSFQNPGPYSACLMTTAVICLAWYREQSNKKIQQYILPLLLLPCVLLPATMSRAAIVSGGIVAIWLYRQKLQNMSMAVKALVATGVVAAFILLYFFKQGSADGRLLTWAASVSTWLHNVWSGVGIGGFHHACAEGIARMYGENPRLVWFESGGVTDYAFNDFLKILVEQGIVGALWCIAAVVTGMQNLYRQSRPMFYGALSLLIFSMFSYPFELFPYRTAVVMLAAWSASKGSQSPFKINKYAASVFLLSLAVFSWFVRNETRRRSKADMNMHFISGIYHQTFIKDYYELLPMELDNTKFLFDFGKTLRESERYNDSNAILRQGTSISNDPMFYILMGNNYRDMQQNDYAETAYLKAFAIMPNRIYPLYQLMMMYHDNGETAKAKDAAQKIIRMKPKIRSRATDEMKEKAKVVADSK